MVMTYLAKFTLGFNIGMVHVISSCEDSYVLNMEGSKPPSPGTLRNTRTRDDIDTINTTQNRRKNYKSFLNVKATIKTKAKTKLDINI